MKKVISYMLVILMVVLTGCVTTIETSKIQNYGWSENTQEYEETTLVYEREADFKFKRNEIEFHVDEDESGIDIHTITINSSTEVVSDGVTIYIYQGILNGRIPCQVMLYESENAVVIFGDNDGKKYRNFVVFGGIQN
jgi:hypothetical protein